MTIKPGQLILVSLVTHLGKSYRGCVTRILDINEKEVKSASLTKIPRGLQVFAFLSLFNKEILIRPEWDKIVIPEIGGEELGKYQDIISRTTNSRPDLKDVYKIQLM